MKAKITKEKTFKRVSGCTAITLVPGPQKGMFPFRDNCPDGVLFRKFHSIGIIEVDNIKIAWPEKYHDRRNSALAEFVEWEDESDGMVTCLSNPHPSLYTAASEILQPNTEYIPSSPPAAWNIVEDLIGIISPNVA